MKMDKRTIRIPNPLKWFKFSLKQSRTWGAILMMSGKHPQWSKKDFATLSREGFQNCMTVYGCVSLIAQTAAAVPWQLFSTPRTNREKVQEIHNHDLLKLIERPNPREGQSAFMERSISFYKLAGNSYIERVGPDRGKPKELYSLRPDRVKVIPGDTMNIVKGYEYGIGAKPEPFYDGEILHLMSFHPTDDWYGLSPIEVAARAVDISNMALEWNNKLLANDARPSGALVSEKNLDKDQRDRLKEDIRTDYSGYENAGRPLLLEAGMSWEQMSLGPKEMDWLNLEKTTLRKICTVFNIAPELMGDTEQKKYSNYQEARVALYMENILPLLDFYRDEFNNWLTPLFGTNLRLDYNRDAIKALKEEQTAIYDRMGKAWWTTVDEKRKATGFDELGTIEGQTIFMPLNLIPISESGVSDSNGQGAKGKDKASFWQNKAKKKALWMHFLKRVDMKERRLYGPIKKYLQQQARDIKKAMSKYKDINDVDVNSFFNVEKEAEKYAKKFDSFYKKALQDAGEAGVEASQGKLMDLDIEKKQEEEAFVISPELSRKLDSLILESGAVINEATLNKISAMVQKGMTQGWTVEELTQNLHQRLDGLAFSRSRRIANTEMGKVENFGQLEGYRQSEMVELKGWLSAFLPTTRDEHAEADYFYSDNPIPLDDAFEVGGEMLQYPGDPAGSPGNIIECKCTTYPEVREA